MKRLWRKLIGLDFPDPKVGQVWQCQYNGKKMEVVGVSCSDVGEISVRVNYLDPYGVRNVSYSRGLGNWRLRLADERRVLEGLK